MSRRQTRLDAIAYDVDTAETLTGIPAEVLRAASDADGPGALATRWIGAKNGGRVFLAEDLHAWIQSLPASKATPLIERIRNTPAPRLADGPISYNLRGAIAATGISAETIRVARNAGQLVCHYYGQIGASTPVFLAEDLYAWLRSMPTEGPAARRRAHQAAS